MHDTAATAGQLFFELYSNGMSKPVVLDVGSMDVNGSLRDAAPAEAVYIGIDIEVGPGVDRVCKAADPFPVDPESVDLCVSTSCFEHDPLFWQTFLRIAECLKDGGYFYLNAPSNGPYHTYPVDVWRFYPDAGLALADWASQNGVQMRLVESGILRRSNDLWNDFVAVFRKGNVPHEGPFLLDRLPAMNVRTGTSGIRVPEGATEDQEIADKLKRTLSQKEATLSEKEKAISAREVALAKKEKTERALRAEVLRQQRKASLLKAEVARREANLAAISQSMSWRITAPLRMVKEQASRLFSTSSDSR